MLPLRHPFVTSYTLCQYACYHPEASHSKKRHACSVERQLNETSQHLRRLDVHGSPFDPQMPRSVNAWDVSSNPVSSRPLVRHRPRSRRERRSSDHLGNLPHAH
jgi:hypothetical protein